VKDGFYNDAVAETYGRLTPEPMIVVISAAVCPKHDFNLVSVPRDSGTGEHQSFKCPLKNCEGK
jgi:hypothetical protein